MKFIFILCLGFLSLFSEDNLSTQAYNQVLKGNYDKSVELYLENSKTSGTFFIDYFKVGLVYQDMKKDPASAFNYFNKSASFYYGPAFEKLGYIYTTDKNYLDYEKAFFHWIYAYELNKLNPDSDKEIEKQIKNNLNILYENNKDIISSKSKNKHSSSNVLLGFAWDLCIEGVPGELENKNMKYCDTKTATTFFKDEYPNNNWARYKSYDILERYAKLYKLSNKGEKENLLADKAQYNKISKTVLDGYKELAPEFPLANIKLALSYLNGTFTEKNKEEAKKYLKKAYQENLILLSADIWSKYKLDN